MAAATLAAASSLVSSYTASGAVQPWLDTGRSAHERAVALVGALTLDEKIEQLHGSGTQQHYRSVPGIDRLGVPPLVLTNGPAGIGPNDSGPLASPPATAMPSPLSLAATFDATASREYGALVGQEARDTGSNMLEAPDVNLTRIPTGGRTFESYGEDPHLVATISDAFIAGAQRPGLLAETKHFAENNQELGRQAVDAHVDERAMREVELRAFESNVRNGVGAVMCAYNAVNGVFSCENRHLLRDILRDDWAFSGFVSSDFGAVHSTAPSVLAGMDLEMQSGTNYSPDKVKAALDAGTITIADIDAMLVRRFETEIRFGLFEHPPAVSPIAVEQHGAVARRLAQEGMVLLRNEGDMLPLDASALRSLAVIGPFATAAKTGGEGSSKVQPTYTVSPVDGIRQRVGSGVAVTYDDGKNLASAVAAARAADVAVVMVGTDDGEQIDRASLSLSPHASSMGAFFAAVSDKSVTDAVVPTAHPSQDALVAAVAAVNPKTVVVLKTGGAVTMPWLAQVPTVLETWYPGQEDGNAVAGVLFGDAEPAGRLPITFPANDAQVPARTPTQYPGLPYATATGTGPADTSFEGLRAEYSEGLFIGYRWYDRQGLEPLFPFGFGLSYADFAYDDLQLVSDGHGDAEARFTVENVGVRRGTAVPQIYLRAADPAASGEPLQQLAGTAKVTLDPGERARVRVPIDALSASFYDVAAHHWQLQPGCHEVVVGSSSRDVELRGETVGADGCSARLAIPAAWRG